MALFPFSYVLSTGYTEGPFLLFSVTAYGLTRREGGAAAAGAGILAFLASILRPAGLFLAPMFAWDAWRDGRRRTACLAALAGALAGPLVFFTYLRHLRGDFLASVHANRRAGTAPPTRSRRSATWRAHPALVHHAARDARCLPRRGAAVRRRPGDPVAAGRARRAVLVRLFAFLGPLATGSADSLPRFAMATFP